MNLAALALSLAVALSTNATSAKTLRIETVDSEPARAALSQGELDDLAAAVEADPKDREARFALVQGLIKAQRLDEALEAARDWRARDAYNLVVVRLIGDIHAERGERDAARRAYSAVVELLPEDVHAHRALAHVLKQAGDLEGAHARLRAAIALKEDADPRLQFELADVAQRLGREDEAIEGFEGIIASEGVAKAVSYPAKQRLAQLYAARARAAGSEQGAEQWEAKIAALKVKGGHKNDIKVYLSWDTDRTDVDLWVHTPGGGKVWYKAKKGSHGAALYDDVTSGYGPESFTAPNARPGTYTLKVNFFSTDRRAFPEARGEVVVVLNEGSADEARHVLPYRLFRAKQTVTVAKIHVER